MTTTDDVWAAQDTSPAAIEHALRDLLARRHEQGWPATPSRVLNLVAVVDGAFRGEIENRLERIRQYHPSRTILCAVTPERRSIDAWAGMGCDVDPAPGVLSVCRERIEIDLGMRHLRHLDRVVGPLVVRDLATLLWSPHGFSEAVDALSRLAQVVLIDSQDEPELNTALERAAQLAGRAYVVDLAWLRSTPWRERIAAHFDPPGWRRTLREIAGVTVRHRRDSAASALLLVGWLSSRLGWRPSALASAGDGGLGGRLRSRGGDVAVRLKPVDDQAAPGLGGVSVTTASGAAIELDRAPGGLRATRRDRRGRTDSWTVLGASRGEAGILGEGVRQALLRDPTYRPALSAAQAMVP